MPDVGLPPQRRRGISNQLGALVALCSLAACHTDNPSPGDALPSVPGSDAGATVLGSDAAASPAGSDATVAGDGASSLLSPDNFPATFANAVCDSMAVCCKQAGLVLSSCRPTLQSVVAAWITKNTSDPKVTFDQDAAARCIEVTQAGFTACTDRDLAQQSGGACTQMARGTVALGDSCTDSRQCAPVSGGTATCADSVCTAGPPPPTIDGPHATLGAHCDGTCRPTNCSWSGSNPLPALCWTDDGVYCSVIGICVATPAVGEPCVVYCGKDAHCADNGLCAPNLTTGPCQTNDDCLSQAYCYRPNSAVSGQCTLLKENGIVCTSAKECASGQCLSGTCRPWSMANDYVCAGVIF